MQQPKTVRRYRDKLAGLINEEFWRTNMSDWSTEELKVQEARGRVSRPISKHQLYSARKTLELAQTAHYVYFTLDYAETRQIAQNRAFELRSGWRKSFRIIP
jgi:hypothetical protein